MIGFLIRGRVMIKIKIRVRVRVRVTLTLGFTTGAIVAGANVVHSLLGMEIIIFRLRSVQRGT